MTIENLQATELAPHLSRNTLANGFVVIVRETPGTRAATVQIWVKAGSVYEKSKEAGITHFIEHMIFKGTPTRPAAGLAGAIEERGGRVNAYTSYEETVYHATLPARYWAFAMDVLGDAVLNSLFDAEEMKREKKVVLEEIRMRHDQPESRLFQEVMRSAYLDHPYRAPIIGTPETVKAFSRDDILSYIRRHYVPENLAVVVVGDVQAPAVLAKAEEVFGRMSPGGTTVVALPQERPQEKVRAFDVTADVLQAHLAVALPVCGYNHPDTQALDVIGYILGSGESSRLYQSVLDQKKLVYQIHAGAFTPRDPGLFEISAVLDPGNAAAALLASLEELFRLRYDLVTDAELKRAKRNLESDFVFNLERVEGQARVLGSFEFLTGDPREDDYLRRLRAVSRDDIRRVARRYFTPARVSAGLVRSAAAGGGIDDTALERLVEEADKKARASTPDGLLPQSYLPDLYRFKLSNGVNLLVREDQNVPTVAVRAVFPGGLRSETAATNGAFAFLSDLLPKGSRALPAREFAERVADIAADISAFNGKNTFGLKGDFLARFFEEGFELFRDILVTPALDEDEAEKIRPILLAQLRQQEDSLTSLGVRELDRLLFGAHPYGLNTLGSEKVLGKIKVSELRRLYQRHARPERMVLVVTGAVKAAEVRKLAEDLFSGWKTDAAAGESPVAKPPEPLAAPVQLSISRDKEQVHILLGFLGTTLKAEDRYAMEVLETVLSGQSGRLFVELRDRQGLAYSLSSFSLLGLDTGAFSIYIGTSPDKTDIALAGLWRELSRVRSEKISEQELSRAKNILVSHYQLGLQTHSSQAMDIALHETYDMGQDFGNRYIESVEKVDAQMVLEVARKYILPGQYVRVMVGAVAGGEKKKGEKKPAARKNK